MSEITTEELAWAAGIFEGEGSVRIGTATKRNYGTLTAEIASTDAEIVQFFQDHWKGRIRLSNQEGTNRRDAYYWCLAAQQAAQFLRDIYPYLHTTRVQIKASLGIEYAEQKTTVQTICRTPEYRAQQDEYYLRMKTINIRGRAQQDIQNEAFAQELMAQRCPAAEEWRKRKRGGQS